MTKERKVAIVVACAAVWLLPVVFWLSDKMQPVPQPKVLHHSPTPEPKDMPDAQGLISPVGHVRPGTVLYLRGERIGPITSVVDERSELYTDHRILHIVHINFNGRADQTDMASVLRLYRVRPDEK